MPIDAETRPDADFGHWYNVYRTTSGVLCGLFLYPVIGVCLGIWGYCDGTRYDLIYGECFPFMFLFMSIAAFVIMGVPFAFANFRPAKPVCMVREAIWLLAILYGAFGLHCLAAYLFWGDGVAFVALIKGFWGRMALLAVFVLASTGLSLFALLEKVVRLAPVKWGRPPKWKWGRITRKADEFLRRHPTLVVSGSKEFILLSVRYSLWAMALSLLALELIIVAWLAVNRPFKVDSFLGEKFGRVLSCDVERMKLAEPIGVIDEVMLQANGDPSRHLNCIYGYRYLGDVPDEEADRLAEETCAALQKQVNLELRQCTPQGREGFRKAVGSPFAYAVVEWDDNFFQQGKVLRVEVGVDVSLPVYRDFHVNDVLGYEIGIPAGGDGRPRAPFWKFERIVNEIGANGIVNGVHAVHDIPDLKLEHATREFEEARNAVERLHGITMFKTLDYDDVKVYECHGEDVCVYVKMEYLGKKQIRYGVLSTGNWRWQIGNMSPAGLQRSSRDRDYAAFWLCVVVLCCGSLMLLMRRNKSGALEAKALR